MFNYIRVLIKEIEVGDHKDLPWDIINSKGIKQDIIAYQDHQSKKTILHYVIKEGLTYDTIKTLIDQGANVMAQDQRNATPLHYAVDSGDAKVIKLLIDRGADINAQNLDGKTPLHYAFRVCDAEIIKLLIDRGADINAQDLDGKTPLHYPLFRAHNVGVIKLLIDQGANVMAKDLKGKTPLHYADNVELIELLIKTGRIDINAKDLNERTPLHCAVIEYHPNALSVLMNNGADINAQDLDGQTPLHYASRMGITRITKLLIDQGADLDILDNKGYKPKHYADLMQHTSSNKQQNPAPQNLEASYKSKDHKCNNKSTTYALHLGLIGIFIPTCLKFFTGVSYSSKHILFTMTIGLAVGSCIKRQENTNTR